MSQQVLDSRKNRKNFVYILAKKCRSPFNLMNFSVVLEFEFFTKKLVGTPCIYFEFSNSLCMNKSYQQLFVPVLEPKTLWSKSHF